MVFLIQYPQKRSDFEYQTHFRSGKVCVKECYYLKQCRMPYMYGKYKKPLFQFVMGGHILPNISTNKLKIDGPVIISYSVHLKNSKTVIDYSLRSILIFSPIFCSGTDPGRIPLEQLKKWLYKLWNSREIKCSGKLWIRPGRGI